jgi:hypothetical protein
MAQLWQRNLAISIAVLQATTAVVRTLSTPRTIYCNVLGYWVPLRHVFTLLITSEHQMWRARLLKTLFGLLLWFIYDFTSRHYNLFLQCALIL